MVFARPDVVEYPEVEQPETSTVAKRLVLLLGLAYLFLADRFRNHTTATATSATISAPTLIGGSAR